MQQPGPAHDVSAWIGRVEEVRDHIAASTVAALAAALDLPAPPGPPGELPALWHWVFFNPYVRRGLLGPDGHPKRGGFLPPVPLPRRMWAGSRLRFTAPVPIGAEAARHSEILKVDAKSGRHGQLVFVTVRHTISAGGTVCLTEEQDIVYREPPPPGAASSQSEPAPPAPAHSDTVVPDPVLLFRYSALTGNGHRIHYDHPYATREEGYRDLVVHGPLLATLLHGLAARVRPGARLASFSFRGIAPVFADRPFAVEAGEPDPAGAMPLWIKGPDDELAMQASAVFQAP